MRRLHCDAAGWHVFARGIRRLLLFRQDADYAAFLSFLAFGLKNSGCELWSYCLMSNHYHLVLYGSSGQLSTCMHQVNRLYANYHNEKYRLGGHVFDGPYKAFRAPTFRLLLWKVAYVFLNPVKAGLCARPEDYPWSGYRSYVGLEQSPLELRPASLLERLDLPVKQAWDRFHECIRIESNRPSRVHSAMPTLAEIQTDQFESLLARATQCATLPGGATPLEAAVWWGRQAGIAPRFMAKALGIESREVRDLLRAVVVRMDRDAQFARLASFP